MRSLAIGLKVSTILVMLAGYFHVWSVWTVAFWMIAAGILFSLTNRYDWFVTKGGCDLFGSGILLAALVATKQLSHFIASDQMVTFEMIIKTFTTDAIFFFQLYFAVAGLWHISQINRNQYYKYPIVVIVSDWLFRRTYLGIENVKGE